MTTLDSTGKLHDYSVPVFERHGIKTFGVNCLRLDLVGKPPCYLVQAFTTEEDISWWKAAAVSISVRLCQALRSDFTQYFGLLSYHWARRKQCLQIEVVNLKCLKRLIKYQPIARDHLVWKAYDLIEEGVLAYDFDELEGLHTEVGPFGLVGLMTRQCGEEPILTLILKVRRGAIANWSAIVEDLKAICARHGVEFPGELLLAGQEA